jgi:hypothetical protein
MHWYGLPDFYFMTGDETIKEALVSLKDFYLNTRTYMGAHYNTVGGGVWYVRALGVYMLSSSRFSDYLSAVGDTDSAGVLAAGVQAYQDMVKPDLCVSGFPAGCTPDPVSAYPARGYDNPGVSKARGVVWSPVSRGQGWCADPVGGQFAFRGNDLFVYSLVTEGLLALRRSNGPSWSEYENALDLAYGISSWALTESFADDGSSVWLDGPNNGKNWTYNGFRVGILYDIPQVCNAPAGLGGNPGTDYGHGPLIQFGGTGPVYDPYSMPSADQGLWMLFHIQKLVNGQLTPDVRRKLNLAIAWVATQGLGLFRDAGQYQIGTLVDDINNPSATLQDVAFTMADLGSGNYRLSWTEPAGTQSYRIKWCCAAPYGPKVIVNSGGYSTISPSQPGGLLGFDPMINQAFALSPNAYMTWFGSTPVGTLNEPAPGSVSQSITVTTGVSGLTAPNFSVKAYLGSTSSAVPSNLPPPPSSPGPPSRLSMVSGSGQSGTAGQFLATQLVVQVTDASGNPVSGASVTFTVTGGGGSLGSTQVVSNSQGLASTTLTLGATPGANMVTAASGSLTPVTFSETAIAAPSSPATPGSANIIWTQQTFTSVWPGFAGYLTLWFDPVSQQSVVYAPLGNSTTIYSTDIFFYNSATNTFTHLGGTGDLVDTCPADTVSMPGDRHPGWQMAIDTQRNFLWLYGGVNQTCNAGTSPNTNPHQDMYYLKLNSDPTQDSWTQVIPAHLPASNTAAALAYDPDDDVLFAFGSGYGHANWVFCRTRENPSPGVLTARQSTAGCGAPDDWTEVQVAGGTQPHGVNFPGMVYDTATHKVLMYGGMDGSDTVSYNETWAYDVPTRTWTQRALNTTPPPVYTGSYTAQPAMVYNSANHTIVLHQTSNTGAPADWQYDPVADTWTKLISVGGASADQDLVYDSANNVIVGWTQNQNTGQPNIWIGTLSNAPLPPSSGSGSGSGSGSPSNPSPQISIACSPSTIPSGWVTNCTAQVSAGAPSSGATIALASNNPLLIVPASLTIPSGGTSATFTASSGTISSNQAATVTATYNASSPSATISLLGPTVVSSFACNPTQLASGATSTCTLTLNLGAPNTGAAVSLASNNTLVTIPSSVTVGAGNTTASFTATANNSNMSLTAKITASLNAVSKTAVLSASAAVLTPLNPCDLNADGAVNNLDVQIAVNAALGVAACGHADLTGDGVCDVVDVGRVIAAALGGACRTGF